ncbi:beta-aspartyl peptidase [Allomyces macrogynus ATCC 38327]|uniref:Beta-aspartyl peptidase n=1 Tax=Allomyces macrogynus (strain ATCC 38327) TaxID=578462 RepID=A0A0L0T6L4_ALLM3|nr:beta-aspartyl peptidase [Allomyces macrogynus ATCC 38327]|eukprot:KNE70385.1 beta-aspartyl peptidase [Allomyces macrogynus ATCC 38327]
MTEIAPSNICAPPVLVLRGATRVYAPRDLGPDTDILVLGGRIHAVRSPPYSANELAAFQALLGAEIIDCAGCIITPGFIDVHVHITGGGGELGPQSRVPPPTLSGIIRAGVTTVVGCLGTDTVSRDPAHLVTAANALRNDGIACFVWTGGYPLPAANLTGSVERDLAFVDPVVGVGEVAVSDVRGSVPVTGTDLARVGTACRVGGMLAGKPAAKVHVHVGAGAQGMKPLWDAVEIVRGNLPPQPPKEPDTGGFDPAVPATCLYPTHVSSRDPQVFLDALKWAVAGGFIDCTADDNSVTASFLVAAKLFLSRPRLSSDAYGSFPVLDAAGRVVKYGVGKQTTLMSTLCALLAALDDRELPVERVLALLTRNPAAAMGWEKERGEIRPGCIADLLVFRVPGGTNRERWMRPEALDIVIAQGRIVKRGEWIKKGMFEE